jgi:hypothetical protein
VRPDAPGNSRYLLVRRFRLVYWDIRYTKVCETRAVLHKAHGLGRQMVRRTYSAMIPALAMLLSPLIELRPGRVPLDEIHV